MEDCFDYLSFGHLGTNDAGITETLLSAEPFLSMNKDLPSNVNSFSLDTGNLSSRHFPVVTKVIPTGSRAERLWTENSDTDYLVECGPITVVPKKRRNCTSCFPSKKRELYCVPASHVGFYYVHDHEGREVHPGILQVQLAPYLMSLSGATSIVEEIKKQTGGGKAALPASLTDGEKDNVIALRLHHWPSDVKKEIKRQFNSAMMKDLSGEPIFLKILYLSLIGAIQKVCDRPTTDF